MAMYLAGVPVSTIMLLGRWSSDAFICYIQKQVKEFSKGVSGKMIQKEFFFTISNTKHPETKSDPDLLISLKTASRIKNGLCFSGSFPALVNVTS
jgi:hypothetical protein